MGLKIVTDEKPVKVIRKDGTSKAGNPYTLYSLMYPYKDGDEWKNVFLDAQFRKGTDIANKAKILVKDAFLTGSEFGGNTKPKVFVLDYELAEGGEPKSSGDDFMIIPDEVDEMCPFN